MNDFPTQVNQIVERFVEQITIVAQQAAKDVLTAAVAAANDAVRRARGGVAKAVAPTPAGSASKPRAKGAKRPQNEIASTRQRLLDFIQRNPGLRIEQINQALGTKTREAALPLRRLIAEGAIRSEGVKRSMQYFPAEGRPARSTSEVAPPVRRRRA